MSYTDTADHVRQLQLAATLAGHDHGWQHAECVNVHGGGLYAEPVVPERFCTVASWYVAAYAVGVTDFFQCTATD